jgi:hypothetical protein
MGDDAGAAYASAVMFRLEMGTRQLARVAAFILVVWSAVLTQSAAALAVTSLSPITVDECRINNTRSYVSADRPLVLAFTNRRPAPADEIRFTVEYGGRTEHITDRGTFSQNVRIDHAFNGFFNARYQNLPPTCTIDYVQFRDGSTWTATSPSPGPSADARVPIGALKRPCG